MSMLKGPHIITIDAESHKASKIVQVLPQDSSSVTCKNVLIMSNRTLMCTMSESRQAVLESLDTHIHVHTTSSPSNDTEKIMFSTKLGDYLFINNLKLCAASLMAAVFKSRPEDYFPNKVTTLAIHERNFYLCTVPGLDRHAEFAKVADILRKFPALKTLYIVVGTENKKLNLTLASDLESAWSWRYGGHEKLMIWSVNHMSVDDFRDLVSAYAKRNKEWEVPKIEFRCPTIALPKVKVTRLLFR